MADDLVSSQNMAQALGLDPEIYESTDLEFINSAIDEFLNSDQNTDITTTQPTTDESLSNVGFDVGLISELMPQVSVDSAENVDTTQVENMINTNTAMMIPPPTLPEDIILPTKNYTEPSDDDRAQTTQIIDYTKLIEVPPFRKNVEPVGISTDWKNNVPGDIKLDESGKLYHTFWTYDGLANNNLEGYNDFILKRIGAILESLPLKIHDAPENGQERYRIVTFTNPISGVPSQSTRKGVELLYPMSAKNLGADYSGAFWAHAVTRNQFGQIVEEPISVPIGSIPVMIRSANCNTRGLSDHELLAKGFDPQDPGGYFVVSGMEKIIIIQEKLRTNTILVTNVDNAGNVAAKMTCSTIHGTSIVELRYDKNEVIRYKYGGSDSKKDVINAFLPIKLLLELVQNEPVTPKDIWSYIVPFLQDSHVNSVWRKLQNTFADLSTIQDPVEFISSQRGMRNEQQWQKLKTTVERDGDIFMEELNKISDEDAHEGQITAALTNSRSSRGGRGRLSRKNQPYENSKLPALSYENKKTILQNDFIKLLFPQIRDEQPIIKKLYMYGLMIARFGQSLAGIRPLDDRDDVGNKRFESPGRLMEQLFTSLWGMVIRKLQDNINQSKVGINVNIKTILNSLDAQIITTGFSRSFSSTTWGVRKNAGQNVTDFLKRASLSELAAYLGKISVPTVKEVKKPEIRMVHHGQLGYICPTDTPEGSSCLTLDTEILTDTGLSVPISEIKQGQHKVVTYDTQTRTYHTSQTEQYFEFPADKRNRQLYKVTLLDGRTIKATHDHPFLTNKGWLKVEDLHIHDKFYVRYSPKALSNVCAEYIILTEDIVRKCLTLQDFSSQHINRIVQNLCDMNMLPLKITDFRMPYISRLYGYITSSTKITESPEISSATLTINSEIDAQRIVEDWRLLGVHIRYSYDSNDNTMMLGNEQLIDMSQTEVCPLALITSLLALPDHTWLTHASLISKREYLSGAQSTSKIQYWNNTLMNTLYTDLGITYQKDMWTHQPIIIKLIQTIGMYYNVCENNRSFMITEYYRYVQNVSNPVDVQTFLDTYQISNDTLMLPIVQIEKIPSEIVADFSVSNGQGTFIANGIIVHNCGLIKHLATGCRLSLERGENLVYKELTLSGLIYSQRSHTNNSICLVNGIIYGWCDGAATYAYMLNKRRSLVLYPDVCLYYNSDFNELSIYTSSARPTRPLLIVDNTNPYKPVLVIDQKNMWGKSYEELLSSGCVEYLDALEQGQPNIVVAMTISSFRNSLKELEVARRKLAEAQTLQDLVSNNAEDINQLNDVIMGEFPDIGMMLESYEQWQKYVTGQVTLTTQALNTLITKYQYTHCELDPSSILDTSASLLPFSNHNPGARNQFGSQMGKQACGVYRGNIGMEMEAAKTLAFPARPYIATQMHDLIGMNKIPAGQTVTVAFMATTGYNQEDAIIFDEGALQRGAFRYIVYHIYKASSKKIQDTSEEIFIKPTPHRGEDVELYSALNENGIPQIGAQIVEGSYIIGQIRRVKLSDGNYRIDNISTKAPVGINGKVDRVMISVQNGVQNITVKIAQNLIPVRGDKLASRSAQKSVIGLIVPTVDMPRTADGRVPSIIINPLCIPTRMTVGMILELIGSKAAVLAGERINATAFKNFVQSGNYLDELKRLLREYGFSSNGNETMYSGITGEEFESEIFVGPVYYQLLKHLVNFKFHARSGTGPVSLLTRQPPPGRKERGGLRVGEMERDAIIGHGAAALLKGRLCDQSDAFTTTFCKECGIPATRRIQTMTEPKCTNCGRTDTIVKATIPYAFMLLMDFMKGVGIRINFKLVPQKSSHDVSTTIDTYESNA